jgi:hypothetical protein
MCISYMNPNMIRKLETTGKNYDNNDCIEEYKGIELILQLMITV